MIEELESVFKCDEHTEDELLEKYDDLYRRVGRILKEYKTIIHHKRLEAEYARIEAEQKFLQG
tara:strand:- start:556 stop:744 length:189 start_codon:yes stop_codon:yes gene_type:complete